MNFVIKCLWCYQLDDGAIAVKVVCKEMLQKHHFVMSTMHIALCSRAQGLQAGRLERKAAAVQELVALSLSSSFSAERR